MVHGNGANLVSLSRGVPLYCQFPWMHPIRITQSRLNLLWSSDICRHRTGSTLAEVMACCLEATSHYLNQYWLTISKVLGLYSLSGKTSYRKISWSLEAARFGFKLFQSLWNLAGTSAALLPRCLSNFRAIRPLQHPISGLWDFTRFGGKTSYRLVNRGPVALIWEHEAVI